MGYMGKINLNCSSFSCILLFHLFNAFWCGELLISHFKFSFVSPRLGRFLGYCSRLKYADIVRGYSMNIIHFTRDTNACQIKCFWKDEFDWERCTHLIKKKIKFVLHATRLQGGERTFRFVFCLLRPFQLRFCIETEK